MTRDEVRDRVVKVVNGELRPVDPSVITEDSRFIEDLQADSLDGLEIVMELECAFAIEILDEEAKELSTVGRTIDYIFARVNPK